MHPLKRTISAGLMAVAATNFTAGQTKPNVMQQSKNSPCSNIVALAGNVKLDCSNLTPAQKRLIESIPAILNTLISTQRDNTAEIISRINACISGVDEVRDQQADWRLKPDQQDKLRRSLAGLHAKISIETLMTDRNAAIFGEDLKVALDDFGGASVTGGPVYSANINPALKGVALAVSHADFPEAKALQDALRSLGLEAPGEIDSKLEKDLIKIMVGGKPSIAR